MSRVTARGVGFEVKDEGSGPPVVLVHGMMCSGEFFSRQIDHLAREHRVIVPDLRGHGASDRPAEGHTVAGYADDVHALLKQLGVRRPAMVGWSMGAMVGYEYLARHGHDSLAGLVIVDQPPSDFVWPGYEFGFFTPEILDHTLEQLQTDPDALIEGLVAMMLHEPSDADVAWMASQMRRVPATIAATILVSQTLKDYREFLPQISVPCLVAFGADPKLTSPDAGRYIAQRIPGARLELFEHSSHAPFWEEAERFNAVLTRFLQTLDAGRNGPTAR
ncbi:MAG TPA: alpha/beta hydrolase [Solirubrobacteraceae bacterium]|nr:alpha/beta hydrolase [Solirubrobacteraceae bacterium]